MIFTPILIKENPYFYLNVFTFLTTQIGLKYIPTTIHMISSRQWPVYVSGVRDKLDGSSSVSMKQVQ
jgi:hypothetical protein